MKRIFTAVLLAAALLNVVGTASAADTQEEAQFLNLVREVQTQQTQITSNQIKIDSKLAELDKVLREARILASRAGGVHKPPAPVKPPPKTKP